MLSRVIWGTRVSLVAGFVSVALAVLAGGAARPRSPATRAAASTALVMRLMDAVLSFPPLVLALALGAVLGAGLTGVLIALGGRLHADLRPADARPGADASRRASTWTRRGRSARRGWRVAWHHVLPNATAPIVVQASLSVAFAILAEASLSFLGPRHPAARRPRGAA